MNNSLEHLESIKSGVEMGSSLYLKNVGKVLIDQYQLDQRIKQIAESINSDYASSSKLIVVGILKGAFVFLSDLIKNIRLPLSVEFIANSYKLYR